MKRPLLALVALACLVIACTPEPPSPLRIGTCARLGCEPFYLARELGYFGAQPIRIVEYSAATEILRAFRNGALDAAIISLDEVLLLAQHVPAVRVVLVLYFSNGADAIVADPAVVQSFADLRSKRLGLETSALGAYVLARAAELHGVGLDELSLVPLSVDEHIQAYQQQRVDALVTYEPVRSMLSALGAQAIFDSREMPGEMLEVVAIHEAYLERHPEVVAALLAGWFQAIDYLQSAHDAVARMAAQRALPEPTLRAALHGFDFPTAEDNVELLAGPSPRLVQKQQRLAEFMYAHNLLRDPVDLDAIPHGAVLQTLDRP